MHRNLYLAISLLAVACTATKPRVAAAPTSTTPAACRGDSRIAYVVDGKSATCASAMSLPADRIASIEVLKGPAAASLYGPSAAAGVVVIQTKR
jgi:TonB-dependent SusC/RagA subfamily outer membrane receptor